MAKIQNVLRRYSRLDLPIHFTENTLISGELMPPHIVDLNDWQVDSWPSTPEGEERQAREVTEMYTTLFEHPLVEAITSWSFTDDAWLHAPAGFIRTDGSLKPSYEALRSLIHGQWETHLQTVTDPDGWVTVQGFKGDYKLSCGQQSIQFSLTDGTDKTVTVRK